MPAMRSGEVLVYLPKQGPNERSKPVRAPPASRYSIEVFFHASVDCKVCSGRVICGSCTSDFWALS